MAAIEVEGVSKRFTLQRDRPRSFQELFLYAIHRGNGQSRQSFWALRDVNCLVPEGAILGIIGENGSGKSTLLKLIARIIEPTHGCIRVHAPVSALLELGAGFHPDLTGRENIYLNSSILGLSRAETQRHFDDIVAFAELERFIDVPVKHYSSGMYVRLGFAVATCLNPRILLVDEILAVGDLAFQDKCMRRIADLRNAGTTIVFVTHDIDAVQRLCSSAIWLDHGTVRADGPTAEVIDAYRDKVTAQQEERLARQQEALRQALAADQSTLQLKLNGRVVDLKPLNDGGPPQRRFGSREVEITGVSFIDGQGRERYVFYTGQPFTVRIFYRARRPVERPVFGLAIHRQDGTPICGPNTLTSHFDVGTVEGTGYIDYRVDSLPLLEGSYDLSVSAYDETLKHAYDHQHRLYQFMVQAGKLRQVQGFFYIPCTWSLGEPSRSPSTMGRPREAS